MCSTYRAILIFAELQVLDVHCQSIYHEKLVGQKLTDASEILYSFGSLNRTHDTDDATQDTDSRTSLYLIFSRRFWKEATIASRTRDMSHHLGAIFHYATRTEWLASKYTGIIDQIL